MSGPLKPYGWDNDAYEVKPSNKHAGWWMVTCNGIPMTYHFSRSIAESLCVLEERRDEWGPPYPHSGRGKQKGPPTS